MIFLFYENMMSLFVQEMKDYVSPKKEVIFCIIGYLDISCVENM